MAKEIDQIGDWEKYKKELKEAMDGLDPKKIVEFVDLIWQTYKNDRTIFFMGNGGSAAMAAHFAADVGKNAVVDSKDENEKRFKTWDLVSCTPYLTALSNDEGYGQAFVGQLRTLASPGDLAVIISSSGKSENCVEASRWAHDHEMNVAVMVGFTGGKINEDADASIWVKTEPGKYCFVEGLHGDVQHFVVEELKKLKREEAEGK